MATTLEKPEIDLSDYSLVGKNAELAIEKGLAEADWYTSPVSKSEMRKLLERKDGPAIRDTLIWFGLLIGFGLWGFAAWGSWWAIIPFMLYAVIYGSSSDSRWHESSHGTAFKTDWMNNALYEISSFMVMRESVPWRWSHTRHHSDTIIVGRDPEIAVPRPPDVKGIAMSFFNLGVYPKYFKGILLHSLGELQPEEKTYIPESEYGKVIFRARIYVLIYATIIGSALYFNTFLPLLYIGLPNIYGSWLMVIYGLTQHAGLAENVLDHRLNCRTVYMNFINRYLYWNMNYHVEHHMFPLVPYHNLPHLHELVKDDMPTPYSGIVEAYQEIIPTIFKQVKDPAYYVRRKIPTPTTPKAHHTSEAFTAEGRPVVDGWVEVCDAGIIEKEDVIRFDHDSRTFAIYRTLNDEYHATDGVCTHGNTHLADGLVKGKLIECPKHNGRFDITDGSPQRAPVCVALKTYKVKVENGKIYFNLDSAGGCGAKLKQTTYKFKVVSNDNVATYIKELVLEPTEDSPKLDYQAGDYIQLNIPAYGELKFSDMDVQEPYRKIWEAHHVFDLTATNKAPVHRNYSLATNPQIDKTLRFNVRIAIPPRGQDCSAGVGSSYVFNLKPGDTVSAIGPFGTFHIKDTDKEMVYLGGGAGMAPLRAHLSQLFDTLKTGRKVSYWYGARSLQEMFYQDYFEALEKRFENFSFHLALSEPEPEDNWDGPTGFIHEVLRDQYLANHEKPGEVEFYLCGPPAMIDAGKNMLASTAVSPNQISYDEFS
ncbi:NADH:ubiquinone reductase (Na(+)-transporting) subunit F [Rubellicoccus peritrichatus]|uniref:Na(+)-translocating NADH-quinone reductase subunit F n=1 Tax=Rubellicoccus peritrichatus TaxID=3080537 RepID=A0AAQ3L8C7_9BACT|nr:NADH:ubiquinone reductase (Na(+)-transporting) subunit F [Puniceicoccus sp. CR14]WOO40751.1 NADH:ubiquinone reductase (Na(+)-transporting) subunit F [Puniceicoccus sp. CR14]